MKSYIFRGVFITLLTMLLLVGCGEQPSEFDSQTESADVVLNTNPSATDLPSPTNLPESATEPTETPSPIPEVTTAPTATPSPIPEVTTAPTATPTPRATMAPTATPTPRATMAPTATPTPRATMAPTATPTPRATMTPTATPTPAPVVRQEGAQAVADFSKVEKSFADVVKKLRADGLIGASEICIVMDGTSIKADITPDSEQADLILSKDVNTGIYTLQLDDGFVWLEGLGEKINGIDPAKYNKDLLLALLSVVSEEPQAIFDILDQSYFSSFSLGNREWTAVGDCYMMDGEFGTEGYVVFQIANVKPQKQYCRDASFTMIGTGKGGSIVECVIEYDSTRVYYEPTYTQAWNAEYEFPDDKGYYLGAVDQMADEFLGYPVVRTGVTSYNEYKDYLSRRIINRVEQVGFAMTLTEYASCEVNGFTYYFQEASYCSNNDIGYYNTVYVQISETEFIELCGVWFYCTLEDFVNQFFYIKEVTIK